MGRSNVRPRNIIELCNRVFPDETTGCWEWRGAKGSGSKTYGTVRFHGKWWFAHRLSFYLTTGHHPGALFVCHKCDKPSCVNPEHLFLGTQLDNVRDCAKKGRRPVNRTIGSSNSQTKLTNEQVILIKQDRESSTHTLGKKFRVNHGTIRAIRRGRSWRYVNA